RDAVLAEYDAELAQRGVDPNAALSHRGLGEPHHFEGAGPACARDLDTDGARFDADERGGVGCGEHAGGICDRRASAFQAQILGPCALGTWRPPFAPGESLAAILRPL